MTAIGGLIRFDGGPTDRQAAERMKGVLASYGPDAQSIWRGQSVSLIRALLRVTPEDYFDFQPMKSSSRGLRMVFDGRLDNRSSLMARLDLDGSGSRLSDCEIALRTWERFGAESLNLFLGDFAIACVDVTKNTIVLARDPLGIRPLFWCKTTFGYGFASLPKALFAIPGVMREVCEERLHDFLCLMPPTGPESFFKGVYRILPGHFLEVNQRGVKTRRYHNFEGSSETRFNKDSEYLEALDELLTQAVDCRLRRIGPLACHLSSGLDSSLVAAVAATRVSKASDSRVFAFTSAPAAGYSENAGPRRHVDEVFGAQLTAAMYSNMEHRVLRSGDGFSLDSVRHDVERMDGPATNPCNHSWVNAIDEAAASNGSRVLLTGNFGNLSFSYDGWSYVPALLRKGRFFSWLREFSDAKKGGRKVKFSNWLKHSSYPLLPAWAWRMVQAKRGLNLSLDDYAPLSPEFCKAKNTAARAKNAGWDLGYQPFWDGRMMRERSLLRVDAGTHYLAVNQKGLEHRSPAADLRVIEFCLSIPDSQYWRDGRPRWLARRLGSKYLPSEVMACKTSGIQFADWHIEVSKQLPQLTEFIEEAMEKGSCSSYLDLPSLLESTKSWPTGGWHSREVEMRYRLKLLRGLSAAAFIRYAEGDN